MVAPKTEVSTGAHPLAMLNRLIEQGADPESLGKMMDLAERWEAREAKRRWTEAVAEFRSELLPVVKRNAVHRAEAKGGGLLYHFASYADVKTATSEMERKYGLVTSYSFVQEGERIVGTLKVTVGSHTESATLPIPISAGQNTNAAQNYGLTVTYLKRYLYCAFFDIIVRDADTDGNPPLHDNPEPDPQAPRTPPRGQRQQPPAQSVVAIDELAAIAAEWKEQNPDQDNKPAYLGWLRRICDRDFNPGVITNWTLADVAKCRAALKMEGT